MAGPASACDHRGVAARKRDADDQPQGEEVLAKLHQAWAAMDDQEAAAAVRTCPDCAEDVTADGRFCPYCGRDLEKKAAGPPRRTRGRSDARPAPRRWDPLEEPLPKSPFLALFLAFVFTGAGQVYAGRPVRGLLTLGFALFTVGLSVALRMPAVLIIPGAVWIFGIVDAYGSAQEENRIFLAERSGRA